MLRLNESKRRPLRASRPSRHAAEFEIARGGVQTGEEVVPPPGMMRDFPEMRPPFGADVRVDGEALRHFDAALAECADELVCKIACNNDPLGGDFRVQS